MKLIKAPDNFTFQIISKPWSTMVHTPFSDENGYYYITCQQSIKTSADCCIRYGNPTLRYIALAMDQEYWQQEVLYFSLNIKNHFSDNAKHHGNQVEDQVWSKPSFGSLNYKGVSNDSWLPSPWFQNFANKVCCPEFDLVLKSGLPGNFFILDGWKDLL